MTHRFPIKEIAAQSGLGVATVDRVLNNRAHVSPQTRARVNQAIQELIAQETQLSAKGRRLFIDIVIEAPKRFTDEVRQASEAILPQIQSAVFRPRYSLQEMMDDEDVLAIVKRIKKRGSHGVCLKARDTKAVRQAVQELEALGIPVVTLVTDLPNSARLAYAGLDNENAGRIAAYLTIKNLKSDEGTILTTQSQTSFFGEAERASGFRQVLKQNCPKMRLKVLSGGAGLAHYTGPQLERELPEISNIVGVYSMGGGNQEISKALKKSNVVPEVYIAHDLDRENILLLKNNDLDFILYHDLRADMRNVFAQFAYFHRLLPKAPSLKPSDINVITPFNIPS